MDAFTQKAHFFRRASFGANQKELGSSVKPVEFLELWLQDKQPVTNLLSNERPESEPLGMTETDKKFKRMQLRAQGIALGQALLAQMVTASNPLHEKVVNFWRDHFVVSAKKFNLPHFIADYDLRLRTHALGDFQDLLWSVTTSPAMLRYLDNGQNRAGNPNENYSRELLELFTLGRGQYTEQDVQEGARALTGWVINPLDYLGKTESRFIPRRHDSGLKTYLGRQGNLKAEDVVEIVSNHPSTARTLARKLWSEFVYPNPEPAVIQRLAKVYQQKNRNIQALIHTIFTSPEFYSTKAYRSRLKNPLYFTIGALRQLEIQADYRKVLASLKAMEQLPYNAPSVKGWPEDEGWLNAPSLLTRINLAQQFTQDSGDEGSFVYEPEKFSPKELTALLLDSSAISVNLRSTLQGLSNRERAAFLLASPLYQLA
jgi:uncharacterized protein (DUF1800 family)